MKAKANPKPKPKVTAAEIARMAGCSRPLVVRLLKRGMTAAEIIARAEARRGQAAAKSQGQGNSKANGIPPFSESQAKKEAALAQLREHELGVKRKQFYPAAAVDRFVTATILRVRDRFLRLPSELRDRYDMRPGAEVEALFDREIRLALADLARLKRWRQSK